MKKLKYVFIGFVTLLILYICTWNDVNNYKKTHPAREKSEIKSSVNDSGNHGLCMTFPYLIMKGLSIVKINEIY